MGMIKGPRTCGLRYNLFTADEIAEFTVQPFCNADENNIEHCFAAHITPVNRV